MGEIPAEVRAALLQMGPGSRAEPTGDGGWAYFRPDGKRTHVCYSGFVKVRTLAESNRQEYETLEELAKVIELIVPKGQDDIDR
jgi:hypothetical protein